MTINPALHRGIQIFLLICLCLVLSPHPKQQAQTRSSPPAGLNVLSIPYYSVKGDWESTLTLSCAWPEPLTASLTVFSLDGAVLPLSDFHLDPYQSMPLRLSDLIRREGERGQFQEGSIELRYNGPALAIGAQLTVQDLQHSLSFDMEPPTAPFKSSTLEGLWWSLDEKTAGEVMISNRVNRHVTVTPTVQWQSAPYAAPPLALAPHQTAVLNIEKLLKDLRLDSKGIGLGGLTLTHNGPPGAVIAHGVIMNKDTGFSSNLNFIDPAAQKSSVIEGTGLMLGHPADAALRSADFFTPVLLLKNITQTPQTVGVTLQYSVSGSLQLKMLPAITVAPHEVRMADFSSLLSDLQGVAVDDAGIKIESSGSPGSVLAQLTSINERGEMSVDVPLKTPPPRFVGNGAHPFSFDGDTQAVLHLKNIGSQPTEARVRIFFTGGEYDPELVLLQPSQSLAIDLRQIRDSQKKDIHGHQLPQDLSRGQIHWFQSGGQSVVGHLVSFSPSEGVSATFACGNGCCGDSFVSLNVDPANGSILEMTVDESITVLVMEQKLTCIGGTLFRDVSTDSMTTISTSDTSVAAINSGVKNQIDLIGPGSAIITVSRPETTFDSVPGDCLPPFPSFDVDPNAGTCPPVCVESLPTVETSTFTVLVKPRIDSLSPDRGLIGTTLDVTINGAGFGSNSTVNVAGTGITPTIKTKSVTKITVSFAIASAALPGNHAVTVTSRNQTSAAKDFFVQIPTSFRDVSVNITDLGCAVGAGGVGVAVVYQVVDQAGNPIEVAGLTPQEHFTTNGVEAFPGFMSFAGTTGSSGQFTDTPVGTCIGPPIPSGNPCFDVVQTFNIVVPTGSGNMTFPINTITTRRDCAFGIRVTVSPGETHTFGIVN